MSNYCILHKNHHHNDRLGFAWYFFFFASGDILGLTKLQGPITYNYKDLKSATKSFSEEYKIGEGGFGDVYKVIPSILYYKLFDD